MPTIVKLGPNPIQVDCPHCLSTVAYFPHEAKQVHLGFSRQRRAAIWKTVIECPACKVAINLDEHNE